MPEETAPPIYSTRDVDASLTEAVDRFIISLAERVDALQDADLQGDLEILGDLALQLAESARELGYQPLTTIAMSVVDACQDAKIEDAQAAMVELTRISCRIRKGHRGAA